MGFSVLLERFKQKMTVPVPVRFLTNMVPVPLSAHGKTVPTGSGSWATLTHGFTRTLCLVFRGFLSRERFY